MRAHIITVYQYSELNEKAKARARDWYREGFEFDGDLIIADAVRAGEMFGLSFRKHAVKLLNGKERYEPNVWWSGFYIQGSGLAYDALYSWQGAEGSVNRIRAEYPIDTTLHAIVDALEDVQRRNEYEIEAVVRAKGNNLALDEIGREDGKHLPAADEGLVIDALRDFARWIYANLQENYEYETSDTAVAETIEANEYEFTDTGKRAGF